MSVYSEIYFHKKEREERYNAYGVLHPEMKADEVVWRVNNDLDFEKYAVNTVVEDGDDILVLVNKYFSLPSDYVPSDLVEADGVLMRRVTAEAYERMKNQAKAEGFSVSVSSAYRSIDEQIAVYKRFLEKDPQEIVDKTVARPCHSEHHTGLAIDVQGSIPGGRNIHLTPEAKWVRENCHRFGFILRYLPETTEITGYASEPWHLRFVGEEVSRDITEKNINTFEEYCERYIKNK